MLKHAIVQNLFSFSTKLACTMLIYLCIKLISTRSVSAVLNENHVFNKKYGYSIMATLHAPAFELPEILNTKTNLADARIGAQVIECSDDFFAEAKRMLQFEAPIFVEDKFDDHGKWMDGWETRRKRHAGYDWCIVKLGVSGKISALDIDTTFLQEIILLLPH